MSIFEFVFEDIQQKFNSSQLNVIYIAVGSANNAEQQYPLFLKKLHQIDNLKINIILIDGVLEDIPLSKSIIPDDITLYTIKENVIFSDVKLTEYYSKNTFNYLDKLKKMNQFCMETHTTLIYQSYTGANMREVAEQFDEDIVKHLDHIIYGLGDRDDFGCFVDFTDKKYNLLTKIDKYIHIYNPYYYSLNEIPFEEAIDYYGIENIDEIIEKNNNAKKIIINYFIGNQLPVIRTFYLVLKDSNTNVLPYIWESIPINDLNLNYLYQSKQYVVLYDNIKKIYSMSPIIKLILSLTNLKIYPNDFINIITSNNDPYKWLDTIYSFIK